MARVHTGYATTSDGVVAYDVRGGGRRTSCTTCAGDEWANTRARFRWAPDHPIGAPHEAVDQIVGMVDAFWGSGYPPMAMLAPSMVGDEESETFTHRVQRAGATPRTRKAVLQASVDAELRPLLPQIRVPTVVLHSRGDQIMTVDHGRHLAAAIAGARFVELPGSDHPLPLADADGILDEVEHVVTGTRATRSVTRASVAVLMSDIVGSTALAAELGDVRRRALLDQHDRHARARVGAHRGTLAKLTGDGVLARFPSADDAIACGLDVAADCKALGLSIRSGVHVGDVELRDDGDIAGLHVHVASRNAALAGPDEILLSEAAAADVTDRRYEPRGDHSLRASSAAGCSWRCVADDHGRGRARTADLARVKREPQ